MYISACPPGWTKVGCSCYQLLFPEDERQTMIWNDARDGCEDLGGGLLNIDGPEEWELVRQYYNATLEFNDDFPGFWTSGLYM